uniref:Uncharacterized protein n=1 Tax=Anguilla anguilla TaxID=7936 RepID=A0A0E9QQ19_ANGAN
MGTMDQISEESQFSLSVCPVSLLTSRGVCQPTNTVDLSKVLYCAWSHYP